MIQQNAGAASEIAATAEGLSSQAAQLQQQAGYFRLGGEAAPAPAQPRLAAKPVPEGPRVRQAKPAMRPDRGSGFALALGEGHDAEDHQFERLSA